MPQSTDMRLKVLSVDDPPRLLLRRVLPLLLFTLFPARMKTGRRVCVSNECTPFATFNCLSYLPMSSGVSEGEGSGQEELCGQNGPIVEALVVYEKSRRAVGVRFRGLGPTTKQMRPCSSSLLAIPSLHLPSISIL